MLFDYFNMYYWATTYQNLAKPRPRHNQYPLWDPGTISPNDTLCKKIREGDITSGVAAIRSRTSSVTEMEAVVPNEMEA